MEDEVEVEAEQGKTRLQTVGLLLGIVLFLIVILFFDLEPGNPVITRMAAVTVLMATWWILDAVPLYATALVPMVLYPLLGIASAKETAPIYCNSTIFLFMGGFMIALTMEKWNLHKRIAVIIIRAIGGGPARIVLGFMAATAFLSMWMSNTATAIMMLPIALAIIAKMEESFGVEETHKFSVGLLLGIAYSASAGGMATLVGTPPNLALVQIFEIAFPKAPPIAFGTWFFMALPLTIILLALIWLILTKVMYRVPSHITIDRSIVEQEYKRLGPMSFEERVVMIVFGLTALLWVFRNDLILGFMTIPGWSHFVPNGKQIDDGTVGLLMALTLFFIPTKSAGARSSTIMGPDVVGHIPWSIILLFGGGFALASGFQVTGLSAFIGKSFVGVGGLHPIIMVFILCAGMTFLTEVTSNTATTQMLLPILASVAVDIQLHPLLLMIPATLSASCAFMMPVATPPNAIVFGSGRMKIAEMARTGL
ncbi:MAG: SLC13 family permease, partial [Desulfobacterales bacterium]|nr:SLC13 family permease [Desulfobacterales bacterium]